MKKHILIHSIIAALALPTIAWAADPTEPGKSGDAVTVPATTAPARSGEAMSETKEPNREMGKSGDAVKNTDPTTEKRQFSGKITAVNREEKTITISDSSKASHKLHIGETTKLMLGEKTASWSDLKVGSSVEGSCRGTMEKAHAEMINISM